MNPKKIVQLSNILGLISIIALVYWVFVFILMEVFGLKVFRENMTETFYMSILGILALMFGSLMINIMFNMTRIAEKHNNDQEPVSRPNKIPLVIFAASFVVIGIFLSGDALTKIKREKLLIASAKNFIQLDTSATQHLLSYKFEKDWINKTTEILNIFNKYDSSFRDVNVIVDDSLGNNDVFLYFQYWDRISDDTKEAPQKLNYLLSTDLVKRAYLTKVFTGETKSPYFSAHDGHYELFYPYTDGTQTIILYFTDQQNYGKMGS